MNIPIWVGSSSFAAASASWASGSGEKPTPFGFYDNDVAFKIDADNFALFASRRLGWPILDVELQDVNFWTAFEAATTIYGNELYAFRLRDTLLTVEGGSTGSNLNDAIVTPNMSNIIRITQQYGTEAGVGGNVNYYSGSIILTGSLQDYDLNDWAVQNNISASDLEIRKVFYEASPAMTRLYDPYVGTGIGMQNLISGFGWAGQSPAINFMMMPINFDLQVIQAIEFNDQIRKSHFTFDLVNNLLRIFPIPTEDSEGMQIWFRYLKKSERTANSINSGSGLISNASNVPYNNPVYSQINAIGRSWIFEYALALVKEILGYIRDKYKDKPVPNAEFTLNGNDLLAAAADEKEKLIEKLRIFFDETSRRALLERQSQENSFVKDTLGGIPLLIYIA